MTDQKLLELAAKAAGIELQDCEDYFVRWEGQAGTFTSIVWNPLTDDGDALRLAVKLGLTVSTKKKKTASSSVWTYSVNISTEPHCGDPYAATRRAIVRAAAEIGKNMCK